MQSNKWHLQIYKFRNIFVLQIISIITKQLKRCLSEEPYSLQKWHSYLTIESVDQSMQFVAPTY